MVTGAAAVSIMAMSVMPVMAADPNKELKVGYTETATYTLSIPTEAKNLSETEEVTQAIGLSQINVGTKQKVQIKIASGISDGKVALTDEKDGDNVAHSLVALQTGATAGITSDAVVAEYAQSDTTSTTLYFGKLGDIPAGTYTGTITFSASIVETITP